MTDELEPFEERRRLGVVRRLKLEGLPRWVHGVGIGGTLVVLLLFIGVFAAYRDVNVWEGWTEAREFSEPSYAERIHPHSVFRTRMNTWSNLAYIFLGLYAIGLAIHDFRNPRPLSRGYLVSTPMQTAVLGVAGLYVGLGSGFFHASLTRLGQQCDVGGMYATMFVLGSFCVGSWAPYFPRFGAERRFPTWPLIVIASVGATIYFSVYKWSYSFGEVTRPITLMLFVFVIVSFLQRSKSMQIRWFILAVVSIIGGGYIRELDIQGTFSSPDAICQGHSVWHLLSSLFYAFLYFYFRSEERAE